MKLEIQLLGGFLKVVQWGASLSFRVKLLPLKAQLSTLYPFELRFSNDEWPVFLCFLVIGNSSFSVLVFIGQQARWNACYACANMFQGGSLSCGGAVWTVRILLVTMV